MAQIMAVTGNKSASSVAVYQRVSSKEKQVMGDIITSSVRGEQPSQLFWGPNEGDRKRTYIPRLFSEYMLTFRVE
jgi:ribosomal protein L14